MELGYKFTKIGDCLEVKAEDLSVGSHMVVTVVCDYCGNEFEREYVSYIKFHNKYGDACCNCAKYKQEKRCMKDMVFVLRIKLKSLSKR